MKKILITFSLSIVSILFIKAQNVGIGTNTPQSELHLHSGSSSFNLKLSNNITTPAINRGANLRMLGGNLFMQNSETGGNIFLETENATRMTILPNGNVGIGVSPSVKLHVEGSTLAGGYITKVVNNGAGSGIYSNIDNAPEVPFDFSIQTAIRGNAANNIGVAGTSQSSIGLYGSSGSDIGVYGKSKSLYGVHGTSDLNSGVYGFSNSYYGVHGISGSSIGVYGFSVSSYGVRGSSAYSSGVYGTSNEASGVRGYSDEASGVYGISNSSYGLHANSVSGVSLRAHKEFTHTGIVSLFENSNPSNLSPVLKIEQLSTAPGLLINTSTSTGVELLNSSIKVTGNNKMAFKVVSAGVNPIVIPNTGFAKDAADILIITRVGVLANVPNSGYYIKFVGANWGIYREDGMAFPVNETFNVLVFKQ